MTASCPGRYTATSRFRYIHVWEMRHLLTRCGYQVIDLFGDFERTHFDETSTEMVWVTAPED